MRLDNLQLVSNFLTGFKNMVEFIEKQADETEGSDTCENVGIYSYKKTSNTI